MTAVIDHAAELEKEIDDLFAPLKSRDADLSREITELELQVQKLRALQKRVRTLIRTSEPDYQKVGHSRNGKKAAGQMVGTTVVWPKDHERADLLGAWLVERTEEMNAANEGEGFYAGQLEKQYADSLPVGLRGSSSCNKALAILHQRGVIRLMRVGYANSNRTRIYKVVA